MTMLLCAGLEDVEPKSHLIVVAEREAFKLRAEVNLEAEPPQSTDLNPSSNRTITPPRARPANHRPVTLSENEEAEEAPDVATAEAEAGTAAASTEAHAAAAAKHDEPIVEAPVPSATFRKYDVNGDGVLDEDEVINMMQSLGYKTDQAYLDNIMEVFASFDGNQSGVIEPNEFEQLFAHLVRGLPKVTPGCSQLCL